MRDPQQAGVARSCLAAIASLIVSGCAASPCPNLLLPSPTGPTLHNVDVLRATHPIPEGQNILPLKLGETETLSYHFIQISDREAPHIHRAHAVVVTLLQGQGDLHQAGRVLAMRAGDTAVVPQGVPHYFVNTGDAPAAAFVTFTPPYDGKDSVPVN